MPFRTRGSTWLFPGVRERRPPRGQHADAARRPRVDPRVDGDHGRSPRSSHGHPPARGTRRTGPSKPGPPLRAAQVRARRSRGRAARSPSGSELPGREVGERKPIPRAPPAIASQALSTDERGASGSAMEIFSTSRLRSTGTLASRGRVSDQLPAGPRDRVQRFAPAPDLERVEVKPTHPSRGAMEAG